MSVIIKGMKLPKNCDNCDLIQFDDEELEAHCPLSPYYRWCGTPPDYRPEGCSLVEVPTPHGRLIEEPRAIYYGGLCQVAPNDVHGITRYFIEQIQKLPTIIEAEVSE